MKKTLLLAGLAIIAFACNNEPGSHAKYAARANQGAQHGQTSNTKNQMHMNPITETMETMMQQMHGATPTGNNEIDFAVMMMAHHKGAVEMSKVEIDKGSDAELRAFAQKVIDDQNKEIGFMQDFLSKAEKTTSSNAAQFQKALNHSMMAMMNANTPVYNNPDMDFAAQMIPHHQSAVDMAKVYLAYGQETSLKTLCENIIRSQTTEIAWLKAWLDKRSN